MFALVGPRHLPAWTDWPLALVGPAAIGALVGGMLPTNRSGFDPADWTEIIAVTVAFVVVRRSGDVFGGLVAGFACLWIPEVAGL